MIELQVKDQGGDFMIENIPQTSHFDRAAKASFFSAWNELMHTLADFDLSFPPGEAPQDGWPPSVRSTSGTVKRSLKKSYPKPLKLMSWRLNHEFAR